MNKAMLTLVVAVMFIVSARGQGFLNLDFESAYDLPGNPPVPDGVFVPVTNALPNWTAYDDGHPYFDINYVSNSGGGAASVVELAGGSVALSGNFSVALVNAGSISQTGLVPTNAESLQFEAQSPGSLNAAFLSVTLGGQSLSYSPISEGPYYSVYGVDIPTDLDGQTEALTFSFIGGGYAELDDIDFSPETIPEPGEFGLVGLGVVLFGVRRSRKRHK